ncbi:hypothetical protein PSPO01_10237 [Paraphaeosphaeria sporulosa]
MEMGDPQIVPCDDKEALSKNGSLSRRLYWPIILKSRPPLWIWMYARCPEVAESFTVPYRASLTKCAKVADDDSCDHSSGADIYRTGRLSIFKLHMLFEPIDSNKPWLLVLESLAWDQLTMRAAARDPKPLLERIAPIETVRRNRNCRASEGTRRKFPDTTWVIDSTEGQSSGSSCGGFARHCSRQGHLHARWRRRTDLGMGVFSEAVVLHFSSVPAVPWLGRFVPKRNPMCE